MLSEAAVLLMFTVEIGKLLGPSHPPVAIGELPVNVNAMTRVRGREVESITLSYHMAAQLAFVSKKRARRILLCQARHEALHVIFTQRGWSNDDNQESLVAKWMWDAYGEQFPNCENHMRGGER